MKTKIGILGTGRILFMLATLSVLFAYASASALEPQILASLTLPNGVQPQGGLILGPDGNFYGTTRDGGSNNLGTVFRMTPNGVLTSLFAFNGTNGSAPRAGLALGKDGNFYGTTTLGGSSFFGTVFRFSTNGTLRTLASFDGTNGGNPQCQLVMDSSGNFYGTAPEQGPDGFGTVFRLTTNGVLTTLVSLRTTAQIPRTASPSATMGTFMVQPLTAAAAVAEPCSGSHPKEF